MGDVTWGGLCDVAGLMRLWYDLVSFCGFDVLRTERVGGCVCGYGGLVSAVDYVAAGPLMLRRVYEQKLYCAGDVLSGSGAGTRHWLPQ